MPISPPQAIIDALRAERTDLRGVSEGMEAQSLRANSVLDHGFVGRHRYMWQPRAICMAARQLDGVARIGQR